MLLYLLFALTVSAVLTALFTRQMTLSRQRNLFIAFFAALLALAGAVEEWLFPVLAGLKAFWLPAGALVVFAAILAASATLSVRTPHLMRRAVEFHGLRSDVEATAFDLLLWLTFLAAGIAVLRSMRM